MARNEIKEKKVEDLKKELKDKREALRVFRFGAAGSRVKNVKEGRNLRRHVAQILTELKRRSLEETTV